MNLLVVAGNIGSDAVLRMTKAGKPVCGFSVAMDSGWGDNKKTNWVKCSIWGDRAEKLAPYLLKGGKVTVSGELSTSEWTNKDGELKTDLQLNVREVTLQGSAGEHKPAQASVAAPQGGLDDMDIPFAQHDRNMYI